MLSLAVKWGRHTGIYGPNTEHYIHIFHMVPSGGANYRFDHFESCFDNKLHEILAGKARGMHAEI